MSAEIQQRTISSQSRFDDSIHPVLQRIYLGRDIQSQGELDYSLKNLLPFSQLKEIDAAVKLITNSIKNDKRILIVADFDADGATSCALGLRCLSSFGARHVEYLVPNRFDYGYGLTPEIVQLAADLEPDLIITVDNGISSIDGVKEANRLGIDVLVTDHHLPGAELPDAAVIVNPNQAGDQFPSKNLAGVGVIFNIMIALRAHLRQTGWFDEKQLQDVNLAQVLDLVALGTVADVVPLDYNNRIMVSQGLARIRARQCCPGILAILDVANKTPERITAPDLGFAVGPRLNAAGRLTDMSLGIECLLTDNVEAACEMASQLNALNLQRRQIQNEMETTALDGLEQKLEIENESLPAGLCLYDGDWHQGVVGILASRIKEKYHRPVIIFAPDKDGLIKGSGRSIQGVHIRDILEAIATKNPGLIEKFGGHAMAAGLTLRQADFVNFQQLFSKEILRQVDIDQLNGALLTDGVLESGDLNLALARVIRSAGPWGQGFPEPLFSGEFELLDSRIVGKKHLKMNLGLADNNVNIPAIAFNFTGVGWIDDVSEIKAVYRLDVNEFAGKTSAQLIIEHIERI